MITEPKSKNARPSAEGCNNSGIQIATINPIAKDTLSVPTK